MRVKHHNQREHLLLILSSTSQNPLKRFVHANCGSTGVWTYLKVMKYEVVKYEHLLINMDGGTDWDVQVDNCFKYVTFFLYARISCFLIVLRMLGEFSSREGRLYDCMYPT